MSARAIVVEVSDPPLGAAERAVAISAPEAVLRGLGAAALNHPRAPLWIEGDDAAAAALATAAAAMRSAVAVRPRSSDPRALRLRPTTLAEVEWRARGVDRVALALAGAVAEPRVFVAAPDATVALLVEQAVPRGRAWVALWGGAHGRIVDRGEHVGELVEEDRARLLLVLPAGHALVRRARQSLSTWLRRAQSACASCAMCAPACPQSIPVPELLRVLGSGRGARATTRLAAATDCTACGACDLVCPQAISPARIVDDLGRRLRAGGVLAPARRRRPAAVLSEATAIARLGLSRYAASSPTSLTPLGLRLSAGARWPAPGPAPRSPASPARDRSPP